MSTIGADALSIGGASSFGTSSTLVTPTEDVVIDPLKRDFVTPAEILAEGLGLVPIAGPYLEKVLKTYAKLTASVDVSVAPSSRTHFDNTLSSHVVHRKRNFAD